MNKKAIFWGICFVLFSMCSDLFNSGDTDFSFTYVIGSDIFFLLLFSGMFIPALFSPEVGRRENLNLYGAAPLLTMIWLLMALLLFAKAFEHFGVIDNVAHGAVRHTFRAGIYLSIITITTVGYGDLVPAESSRAWSATEALLGYVGMGIFIAGLAYRLSATDRAASSGGQDKLADNS